MCPRLVQNNELQRTLNVLQGPRKASSKHKSLWQNVLKSLSNKTRMLMVLGSIKVQPYNNLLNC